VQELLDRGRATSEQLVATVQAEVNKQVARFTEQLDGVERRLEELGAKLGVVTAPAAAPAAAPATKAAGAEKAPAAKKAPARKAAAAKKAPAKKAPAKKAAGPSGVAKVATKKAAKN
jgi:hypothetical protein